MSQDSTPWTATSPTPAGTTAVRTSPSARAGRIAGTGPGSPQLLHPRTHRPSRRAVVSARNCRGVHLSALGEVAKLLWGVAPAADRGVDVEEVAGGGAVAESIHLARHGIVGMWDRADVGLDRRLGAPGGDQLHPVLAVRVVRIGGLQPRKRVQT